MKAILSVIILAAAVVVASPASAQQEAVDRFQTDRIESLTGQVWAMSLVQEQLIKLAWGTTSPVVVKALVRGAKDTYDRVVKKSELVRQHSDLYVQMNQGADEYFDRLDSLLRILEDATKKGDAQ